MRLIHVAKALSMTGQELRHELLQVDFGVKPTDREVSDTLAQGIIRYLARKYNITPQGISSSYVLEESEEESPESSPPVPSSPQPSPAVRGSFPVSAQEAVPVLRKLTLEDIPRPAPSKCPIGHVIGEDHRGSRLITERSEERKKQTLKTQEQIKHKEGIVLLPARISVKEFAEKTGVQVPLVIETLMKNGVMATVNQAIDFDTAVIVAAELAVTVEREQEQARAEDLLSRNLRELLKDDPGPLVQRPPIVVIMGHVDHGKTSLLDAIRKTNVAKGEAGGITQHIGAYQVEHAGKRITFLDTPGHEAFTAMRSRGAQITDVAVLVVAADEGVMPTTIEAIHHAREAEVPILVALTKMDKPAANVSKVEGELAAQDLRPEDWGGEVPVVLCSAVTTQGLSDLLDHILLLAEMENLQANPARRAIATVIESHLDIAHGPLGTVIVNTGTLHIGDSFVCGNTSGRVRAMIDATGERIQDVPPSGAVRVSGFSVVPDTGDIVQVVASEREARALLESVERGVVNAERHGLTDFVSRLTEGKLTQLKVIVKADAQGSLEAIQSSLSKQSTGEVIVKVIHGGVGAVTESDVMLAAASGTLIIAFHAPVTASIIKTAEAQHVRIREYEVIYALLEDIAGIMQGLLVPEEEEKVLGHLEVKGVFFMKKNEQIIGGRVTDGVAKRVTFRLHRADKVLGQGKITSLRKVEKDVKEVGDGSECGLKVEFPMPIELGDVLEIFSKEFRKRVD
ncbi:translation initiation factor IF-2 [Candidatus Peribacteria bacterium RIFCSPLOWO2_12_FULL_55_15]|nr:MAG: translation initiation factor IF-2 [Candidatus Peribacteria bacterium RIFCSPHIGHO2_01_FULL_54_22]OGJ68218.1 MAG: translation initiation factor IF-2 [Candidatus Peribacteria bacterium RIFCSPLOWO2_01_FULL_54_110]OGJ70349.1 MAG: translation initiation factor IF-2 [Candidatus Peribacteria bacterium RIFCSPLOWO2_12_FULL_55_15]